MRECKNCRHYDAYYTKGYKQFTKEKIGYCNCKKKITENHSFCEQFNDVDYLRGMGKKVCLEELKEMAKDISEITQILREETEVNLKKILPPS